MEILVPIIVIIVLIAAYVATQKYFESVEQKFNVNIRKSMMRFVPAIAMLIAYFGGGYAFVNTTALTPYSNLIVILGILIYGVYLFTKIKNILHTIIVTLLMSVYSLVYMIIFILYIVLPINRNKDEN